MKLTFEFESEDEASFAKRLEPFDGLTKMVTLTEDRDIRRACITLSRAQMAVDRSVIKQERLESISQSIK